MTSARSPTSPPASCTRSTPAAQSQGRTTGIQAASARPPGLTVFVAEDGVLRAASGQPRPDSGLRLAVGLAHQVGGTVLLLDPQLVRALAPAPGRIRPRLRGEPGHGEQLGRIRPAA